MHKIAFLVAVAALLVAPPRGHFQIEIPVVGLTAEHQADVEEALEKKVFEWGHVHQVECRDGVLSFYTGGQSERTLVWLSPVRQALADLNLDVDLESWTLNPQIVGLAVSAETGANVEAVRNALGNVRGSLLVGRRLVVVVELGQETDYSVLRKMLEEADGFTPIDAWTALGHRFDRSVKSYYEKQHIADGRTIEAMAYRFQPW